MSQPPRSVVALSDAPLFLYPPAALDLAERIRMSGNRMVDAVETVRRVTLKTPMGPVTADWNSATETQIGAKRPYAVDNGIATIPARGSLSNKQADSWWDETSYEGLRDTFELALADPEVKAILLDVDSPGGEAAGAMETSSFIRNASARKPVVAFVDGMAASAGYALASGAQDIIATPSSTLGSIGVVLLHWDISQLLENVGIRPTLLHSGAFKTDGWPTKALDGPAAARLQRTLDVHYRHFTGTVGAHRPNLGERGARKTEAGVFIGREALSEGLVDAIGDRSAAKAVALARISAMQTPAGGGPRLATGIGASFLSIRAEKMSVHLYGPGRAHADHLIDQGKVDKESSWGFSSEDGDKLLGDDGDDWDTYASFHLGEDTSESEKTKARYKYPFGKDGKVYRSGLIAAKQRAGGQKADDIEEAAGHLLEKIDGKTAKESQMADLEALAAAREEGRIQGVSEGVQQGVKSERERIGAILNHDEAKTRAGAALVFALDTDMSAEVAVKALAKTPVAAAPVTPSRLDTDAPRLRLSADAPEDANLSEFDRGRRDFAATLGKAAA